MQRIERYGVIALVFLLVTILAVSFWGESNQDLIAADEAPADELVAAAPAPALPAAAARTSPATSRGARDRALPTSDTSRAGDAVPRDRDHSRNPNVLDPEPAPASTPAGRRERAREVLPTPSMAPDQPLERNAPARDELRRAAVPPAATDYVPFDADTRTARASEPVAPAPAGAARTCVVGGGETLSQISQRELGTYKRWREIAALNGDLDPAKLRKGMVLKLPPKDTEQAARVVAAATSEPASTARPATQGAATQSAPAPSGGGTYTVRKGDVLSQIAQRELGSSKRWREIAALNPKVDPDRLIVGARLVLPGGAAPSAPRTAAAATPSRPDVSSGVARAEPAPRGGWSGGQAGGKVR